MTKRMLIDATHGEETRVVVLDGNRLEDFDVETSTKRQLKGNIYLAKVVRVEPSLQAAFVEYGGGRHGFLAFGEIHPDYYQIPVADRQRLLQMQAEEARAAAQEEEDEVAAEQRGSPAESHAGRSDGVVDEIGDAITAALADDPDDRTTEPANDTADTSLDRFETDVASIRTAVEAVPAEPLAVHSAPTEDAPPEAWSKAEPDQDAVAPASDAESANPEPPVFLEPDSRDDSAEPVEIQIVMVDAAIGDPDQTDAPDSSAEPPSSDQVPDDRQSSISQPALIAQDMKFGPTVGLLADAPPHAFDADSAVRESAGVAPGDTLGEDAGDLDAPQPDLPPPETIGGEPDGSEDARTRRSFRFLRNYRIQEVIRRRQIMLVQVVKEERGTKGAALTTYVSLAGRFCVLMPNSPRGGGISRKITSPADRRRLKEVMTELDLPDGMGLIVRTDAANRPKPEIKRDCEYLMRLWDDIREHTLRSIAPALIYEEASLIKRAIRDVYSRDVDEILVDGEEGWRAAHEFMRMLMPSHAKKVVLWKDSGQPLFSKYQVEAQLDAMLSPTVQLRSGGYLVINQTEALVAIDVNSGRSTRERGIEETALRTNLEAADEVARQLRLRDLAGLIVIDFIDMEPKKHNAMVERRLKEALKVDRARIQVGHISHFGLMEMSRQRLRPSLAETSFVTCPHCGGLGHVRSIESSAIHVLRAIEEEGAKARASLVLVHVASAVVMYILNHKRERLAEIEARTAMRVQFAADESLVPPQVRIDRLKAQLPESERTALAAPVVPANPPALLAPEPDEGVEEEAEAVVVTETVSAATPGSPEAAAAAEESERRRRRRRRRRGARRDGAPGDAAASGSLESDSADQGAETDADEDEDGDEAALAPPESGTRADTVDITEIEAAPVEAVPHADPAVAEQPTLDPEDLDENGLPRARRRSRRGGRQRSRRDGTDKAAATPEDAAPDFVPENFAPPIYAGPTPADPFGGHTYDIFDLIDRVSEAPPPPRTAATRAPEPRPQTVETMAAEITPTEIAPAAVAPPDANPPPDVDLPWATSETDTAVIAAARSELAGGTVGAEPTEATLPVDQTSMTEVAPVEPVTTDLAAAAAVETGDAEANPAAEAMTEAEPGTAPAAEPEAIQTGEPTATTEPEPAAEPAPAQLIVPKLVGADTVPEGERKRGWWRR